MDQVLYLVFVAYNLSLMFLLVILEPNVELSLKTAMDPVL